MLPADTVAARQGPEQEANRSTVERNTDVLERPARRLSDRWWLGANYWSARGGPFMWRDYDEPTVRRELEILAAHGMDTVRAFCFWADLQPAPDQLDPAGLELLR